MNLAFHADEAVRTRLIQALRAKAEADLIALGPFSWDGSKGSVVGCMLESDDLSQWETQTGLPQWLAVTLDAQSAQYMVKANGIQFAIAALEAIPLGANLQLGGSATILHVFADIEAESREALPAPLASVLDQVRTLHQHAVNGVPVPPAEWRAARKAATTLTDSLSQQWERGCATCIETAAWDPIRSPSVVFDTSRVWRKSLSERALLDYGWNEEANLAMGERLKSLHETYVRDAPEPKPTVFDMLAKYHPEEDERLRGLNRLQRESAESNCKRISDMLLRVLKAA